MGMVKRKMMEVQEEAWQACEEGVLRSENPYTDTMWAATWKEAWEERSNDFDALAEKEDYLNHPELQINYFDGPR